MCSQSVVIFRAKNNGSKKTQENQLLGVFYMVGVVLRAIHGPAPVGACGGTDRSRQSEEPETMKVQNHVIG